MSKSNVKVLGGEEAKTIHAYIEKMKTLQNEINSTKKAMWDEIRRIWPESKDIKLHMDVEYFEASGNIYLSECKGGAEGFLQMLSNATKSSGGSIEGTIELEVPA